MCLRAKQQAVTVHLYVCDLTFMLMFGIIMIEKYVVWYILLMCLTKKRLQVLYFS